MADKQISALPSANQVQVSDLFVLEQTGVAKSLSGQVLKNWLLEMAEGHGGITGWELVSVSTTDPVVKTYQMTLADDVTYEIDVTDGATGPEGQRTYVWIKWAAQQPTNNSQISDYPDAWIGIYTGTSSTAPTAYNEYVWYQYKGEKGDTGLSMSNIVKISGTGAGGSVDTYNVVMSDGTSAGSFEVYNGNDGEGAAGSLTPLSDISGGAVGSAVAYAREDHRHQLNVSADAPLPDSAQATAGSGTYYARYDHRHPLNVDATAPASLGTAAAGSAATYARRDHVHPMPSASDVGAVEAGGNTTHVYTTVTDLNLSSGSTTLAAAYAALPANSVLFAPAIDFTSGQTPQTGGGTYGCVMMVKLSYSGSYPVRGFLFWFSKEEATGVDCRMFLDEYGVPDGTWHKITPTISSGTADPGALAVGEIYLQYEE